MIIKYCLDSRHAEQMQPPARKMGGGIRGVGIRIRVKKATSDTGSVIKRPDPDPYDEKGHMWT